MVVRMNMRTDKAADEVRDLFNALAEQGFTIAGQADGTVRVATDTGFGYTIRKDRSGFYKEVGYEKVG
jgi:hypothetical protein